ncbi:MAG: hypothetical protein KKA19_04405 [Candidatus Margulisbacteria bacterium]|nr:hypothetical protein [Candidatus Margulisiibacteriota bacterium]
MKKFQIIMLVISIIALSLGIFALYAFANLQNDLAKIEIKTLVGDCADLTWDSAPEPNSPGQAIEYINKCIHMNASLQKTKQLIENSDWAYWPTEILMPGGDEGVSKFFFKNEIYPGVN